MKRPAQPQKRSRYEYRVLAVAVLSALPFAALALAFLLGFRPDPPRAIAWGIVALVFWGLALQALRLSVSFPLRTVATLLEALREGDYLLRGRLAGPGDALGEVVREVNLLRDTLAAQRLQVRETVALLGKIIDSVDMAVFTFGPDRRLRLVNPIGRRLAGIEDLDDETIRQLDAAALGMSGYLAAEVPHVIEREFAGVSGRWEIRHRTFRETGQVHHLLVMSDLSRALREEERLAWQRLIRVLGHEINNSLAPIQSISETLQGRLAGVELPALLASDLEDGLALIGARAEVLQRFIRGYTLLARLPQPSKQLVDVAELAERVARLEGADKVHCEGPSLNLEVDPGQLEQALINLVKNAVEAVDGGGVRLSWRRERDSVVIDVDDDGPGLPDSDNLFVPFFTTKPSGNGIGLLLCRRIVEAHGGVLSLDNRPEGGCRARLRLPVR